MKMNHIFMISMMGGSYPAFLMAGDDGGASSSNTIQRSSRTISLGALFRHCSHTSLNDHQTSNHSMVGSLGSNSSGELQIVTTPKMSKLKRLSCMMSRRSSSSSSSSISSPASIVKEVGSEKSLKELERQLEDELETAGKMIKGLVDAAPEIFKEGGGYFSSDTNTTDHNEVAAVKAALDNLREIFQVCLSRTGENFVREYECVLEENFENVGRFCAKGIYMYLGCTPQQGANQSCDYFKQLIDTRISKASEDHTKKLLRQMRYPFSNSETKKNFDAYMREDGSIESLMLDPEKWRKHYKDLSDLVLEVRENLRDAYKKKSASHQGSMSSSSDLADHAFSLELADKTLHVETNVK